jgi:hypothetical protein
MNGAAMPEEEKTARPGSSHRFLRVVGVLWLVVIAAILVGALLAPYLGRMADFVLSQTTHGDWTRLTLRVGQSYFDLTTPEHTIKSYYSALYRGDAAAMARLTAGAFHTQMQQRMAYAEPVTEQITYRSYLLTERRQPQQAVITEKFHLFWQRGLRFVLRRTGTDWHIVAVELIP